MSYWIDTGIPHSIHQTNTHNLMKSTTRRKNQSEGLKVNRRENHLIPPYKQTTQQEQQRYEQSRQLSILPILQPFPGELIQQNIQKINKVVKPKPKPRTKSSTKSKTTTTQQPTTTPKRSKEDLKKQVKEQVEWLNSLPDKF